MGACETPKEQISHKTHKTHIKTDIKPKIDESYKIKDFESDDKTSSYNGSNSTKSQVDVSGEKSKPRLSTYQPELDLKKLKKNANPSFNSIQTYEEIIVKGKINPDCHNEEDEFDNTSFRNLVQEQGGIVKTKGKDNPLQNSISSLDNNLSNTFKNKNLFRNGLNKYNTMVPNMNGYFGDNGGYNNQWGQYDCNQNAYGRKLADINEFN